MARFRRLAAAGAMLALSAGCELDVPSGRFECNADRDCPEGQTCHVREGATAPRCFREPPSARDGGDSPADDGGSGPQTDAGDAGVLTPDAAMAAGGDAGADAAADAGPSPPTALQICNGSWISSTFQAAVPTGAEPRAEEIGPDRPSNQYLCRGRPTDLAATYPGKATTEKADTSPKFDMGCYVGVPPAPPAPLPASGAGWRDFDVIEHEVFVRQPGCSVRFVASGAGLSIPTNALPARDDVASREIFICRATVPESEGVMMQLADGGIVNAGVGTHIGNVSPGTGKMCRYQFYGVVREAAVFEILVVD